MTTRWYADMLSGEQVGPFTSVDDAVAYIGQATGRRVDVKRNGTVYHWASFSPGSRARITVGRVYHGQEG